MKLRRILMLFGVTFLFSCSSKKGPFFIGKINYDYTYESNSLNVDSITKLRPSKSVFKFDKYNYQSQFIISDTLKYFYSGKYNKCISPIAKSDKYDCEDYSIPTDSILSYNEYETDEKILGHSCKIIEFQTKHFWNRYYVATDLKISPDTFINHKAYNWKFYGEKSNGGLILKLEHRFKKFTMKGIATSIEVKKSDFNALGISNEEFLKNCN